MVKIEIADGKKQALSAFVSFEYDSNIVSIIRAIPNRWYHVDEKRWEIPSENLKMLTDKLDAQNISYVILNKELLQEPTVNVEIIDKYEFKTKPFSHQLEGIEYGLKHDKWLLGDEQGLGKTKCAIDLAIIKKMQNNYHHCLIICGVNGLKWNWVNEIHTHSDEDAYIIGQRVKNGKVTVGSTQEKIYDLKHLEEISAYFLITNIESLRNEEIVSTLKKITSKNEIEMIVFDEAHKAKNPTSQQGKGLLKLKAKTMIAMTGTPLMNSPLDLYVIFKWLGFEQHNFYAFKNYYCLMGGYGGYEIVGYKNIEQLQSRLDAIMLRRLKEDVLDLPEKIYVDEYVDMTPKQAIIYNEATQFVRMNIDKIAKSFNPLTEVIRMRQATGYTGILSSTIKESAKIDRLEELVEEAIANKREVVIFSNWTQITDVVYARLRVKYATDCITGATKDNERQTIVEDFQAGRCKVLIGTIGAMGTGLTLTAGTVVIFTDEPWTMADKEQAIDRCHRIGQKNNLTIYTLLAKGTIDERIHDIVEKKGLMSDAIVDNKVVADKYELLDYLIN